MFNLFSKQPKGYQQLDSASFQVGIEDAEASIILDVRSPAEFASGHLEGAHNINVMAGSFTQKINQLPKDQPVFVYCKSGARSKTACNMLHKAGFESIYNLSGGIMGWRGKIVS